jgi:hypothetical protein
MGMRNMKKIALAVMLACNSGLLFAEETAIVNVAEQVQADTAEAPITQLLVLHYY